MDFFARSSSQLKLLNLGRYLETNDVFGCLVLQFPSYFEGQPGISFFDEEGGRVSVRPAGGGERARYAGITVGTSVGMSNRKRHGNSGEHAVHHSGHCGHIFVDIEGNSNRRIGVSSQHAALLSFIAIRDGDFPVVTYLRAAIVVNDGLERSEAQQEDTSDSVHLLGSVSRRELKRSSSSRGVPSTNVVGVVCRCHVIQITAGR